MLIRTKWRLCMPWRHFGWTLWRSQLLCSWRNFYFKLIWCHMCCFTSLYTWVWPLRVIEWSRCITQKGVWGALHLGKPTGEEVCKQPSQKRNIDALLLHIFLSNANQWICFLTTAWEIDNFRSFSIRKPIRPDRVHCWKPNRLKDYMFRNTQLQMVLKRLFMKFFVFKFSQNFPSRAWQKSFFTQTIISTDNHHFLIRMNRLSNFDKV